MTSGDGRSRSVVLFFKYLYQFCPPPGAEKITETNCLLKVPTGNALLLLAFFSNYKFDNLVYNFSSILHRFFKAGNSFVNLQILVEKVRQTIEMHPNPLMQVASHTVGLSGIVG